MFNDEEPISFKKMHNLSPVDGFLEINENLADMIKFVANEPSMGLFYVQQHTQSAVPNVLSIKKNIVEKSHETALHTEDLEDSITMVRSMKECGILVADEMIRDIKKSLSAVSKKQPKRGLIYNSSSSFLGRTSSWSPATWGRNSVHSYQDSEKSTTSYLSSVFKSGKQRSNNLKQAEEESSEASRSDLSTVDTPLTIPQTETEDLPLSCELQEEAQLSKSLSHQKFLSLYENFDEFKADREAKLEEWLGETGNQESSVVNELDQGPNSVP